jgi:hypothetical protein
MFGRPGGTTEMAIAQRFTFYEEVQPPEPPAASDEAGWVYVGYIGDVIKFGWTSRSPEVRCRELSLRFLGAWPGTRRHEQWIHRRFEEYRLPDTLEYYRPHPVVVRYICSQRAMHSGAAR